MIDQCADCPVRIVCKVIDNIGDTISSFAEYQVAVISCKYKAVVKQGLEKDG